MTVDGRFWKGKTEGSEMIPPLCRDCKNEKSWIYKLKKEHNMHVVFFFEFINP